MSATDSSTFRTPSTKIGWSSASSTRMRFTGASVSPPHGLLMAAGTRGPACGPPFHDCQFCRGSANLRASCTERQHTLSRVQEKKPLKGGYILTKRLCDSCFSEQGFDLGEEVGDGLNLVFRPECKPFRAVRRLEREDDRSFARIV